METAGDKKWSTEEPKEKVELQMSSQPSTAPAKAKATGKKQKKSETNNGCKPKEGKPQDTETPGQTRRKVPIPPIPEYLPPVNLIHRDVLRAWCQKKRVSSKGQVGARRGPLAARQSGSVAARTSLTTLFIFCLLLLLSLLFCLRN